MSHGKIRLRGIRKGTLEVLRRVCVKQIGIELRLFVTAIRKVVKTINLFAVKAWNELMKGCLVFILLSVNVHLFYQRTINPLGML